MKNLLEVIQRQTEQKAINEELLKDKEKNFQKLVENNINLVHYLIHRKFYYIEENEDVLQEGILGLILGIHKFDPDRGVSLSTYVSYWIMKKIREYIKKDTEYSNIEEVSYVDEKAVMQLESVERKLIVHKALCILTEKEKKIIIHRYGLFGNTPLTLRELSAKIKLSKSQISILEKKALEKMKKYLENEKNI